MPISTRDFIRQIKDRRLQRAPTSTTGETAGLSGTNDMDEPKPGVPTSTGTGEALLPGVSSDAPMANPDPERQRISAMPPRNKLAKLLIRLFGKRAPTEEEIAMADERKRRKAMEQLLREEARLYQQRIINALNRRELCYRYKKSERDLIVSGIQSVRFDCIVMQPDAIYLRVQTSKLPRGVGILQLVDPDILTDLSLACGHRVSAEYSEAVGCWYIVERAAGALGIPGHVKLADMLATMPVSADGLAIPLGMAANGRPVYRSLSSIYSMLIGGTIGAGKSNFLNVILCTLIRRNTPERLKIMLVDLKGGLEFNFYEGIPHLLRLPGVADSGIAYYREQVPELLRFLLKEGEQRIEVIKAAGFKDIGRFNAHGRKKQMPHIVLVIDEWADIKLDPKTGREAEDLLTNIAQRFRAVGIHVIVCSQVPKTEIISTRIKGVLPGKVAFSCPTNTSSMAIIDNGHAKGLEPVGRCVFQHYDEMQLQSPYITDQFVHETVEGAISGKFIQVDRKAHDVTPLEVMTYALDQDSGWLSVQRLFATFKSRGITYAELSNWLASWEGQEFVIGSSLYRVSPAAGSRARRLISTDTQDGNNESTD